MKTENNEKLTPNSEMQPAITDYVTPMQKTEHLPLTLNRVLDNIMGIEYVIENHRNTDNEEAAMKYLEKLNAAKENYEKAELKSSNKWLEPNDSEICSILCLYILRVGDECGCPVGIIEGSTYFFNEKYWEVFMPSQLEAFLSLAALRSGIRRAKTESARFVKMLREQFLLTAQLPVIDGDKSKITVNLQNGTLTVCDGLFKLMPHSSKDLLRYVLSYNYDPQATALKFQAFLDMVLPEKESQMVLAEYLGYIFTANMKLEKCLVLVGNGMNGKSVVFDIVELAIGKERISSFTLSELAEKSAYNRAELSGKLLNYSSEMGGKDCDPDMVKKLISNEPVSARSPYEKPFILRHYCKFMFNTNSLPTQVEHTPAYFRRFMFMEFNYKVKQEEKNIHLAKELFETEACGIFNWMLDGLKRLLEQGDFTASPKIEATMETIKKQTNSVSEFMTDHNYVPSNTSRVPLKLLNELYSAYCKECNYRPVSKIELSRRLQTLNYEVIAGTNNERMVYCELSSPKESEVLESWIDGVMKL